MKIAFVSASQVPSTTANSLQVMKVCQGFAQLGHEVHLLLPGPGNLAWEDLAQRYGLSTPFEVHWLKSFPAFRRYDLAWTALRLARALPAELVYTRLLQAAAVALFQGMPVMLELHDRITGRIAPGLFELCLRSRAKKRWLPITRALQHALEKDFRKPFPVGEVVVLPDGVDLERFAGLLEPEAARQQLGLSQQLTAVYAGSFYAGRGIEMLFSLAQANPQVAFIWVGGKPADVTYWQERLASAGLKNVVLTGFISNTRVPAYLAAGDILLMPFERRTATSSGGNTVEFCSPMKMFEYMAAGRAIISSDLPVLHEVLTPTNAVFCPPETFSAWQPEFTALLQDPDRRMRLAMQARQDVQQYTWQARAQHALEGFSGTGGG